MRRIAASRSASDLHAAAGVDDRDGVASNDDAKVRDVAGVCRGCQRYLAKMRVVAIGDCFDMASCTVTGL